VTRRRARVVVLALLAVSFFGPWLNTGGVWDPRLAYFPAVAVDLLLSPAAPLALALIAVPITCLAAILSRASRVPGIVHGVLAAVTWIVMSFLCSMAAPGALDGAWGLGLNFAALFLALVVEVIPARRAPARDYGELFR
jgi:hypothetical protein